MTRPHAICQTCFALQAPSFVAQTWLYCSHFRVMARRRRAADAWVLDRNVSPEKARRHVEAALARMAEYAAGEGMTLDQAFALVQRLFEEKRAKGAGETAAPKG